MSDEGVPRKCNECGRTEKLIIHHKDKNHDNNTLQNLEYLCYGCHGKRHNQITDKNRRFVCEVYQKGNLIILKKKVVRDGKYSGKIQLPAKYIGDFLEIIVKSDIKKEDIITVTSHAPRWACEAYDVRIKGCAKNDYLEVTQEMCEKCKREG